ncbi:Hypothetical predicted protein [Podarcis lilfordi]|uniref:Uncharacterized protein n=1 Tax=Podarcis lilfordi TaxID=74358 RepID=A0AA35L4I5_9SAUR|nr:Hypothetical predicted protein [Podarcis lilfordi]
MVRVWSPAGAGCGQDIFCCELLVGNFLCFYFPFCLTGSQAGRQKQKQISLDIVGRGLGAPAKQQPSGATSQTNICRREAGQSKGGKAPSSVWEPFPNTYFVLAKSLERRGERQGHASRDEAPAPAPGMKNRATSRRFPAVVPRGASPLPLLRTGMAPSRPGLAQKQQPKFPPIKTASQVREETLAVASVLGRSDARTVEKWGALIRSGPPPSCPRRGLAWLGDRRLLMSLFPLQRGRSSAVEPPHSSGRDWSPDDGLSPLR